MCVWGWMCNEIFAIWNGGISLAGEMLDISNERLKIDEYIFDPEIERQDLPDGALDILDERKNIADELLSMLHVIPIQTEDCRTF